MGRLPTSLVTNYLFNERQDCSFSIPAAAYQQLRELALLLGTSGKRSVTRLDVTANFLVSFAVELLLYVIHTGHSDLEAFALEVRQHAEQEGVSPQAAFLAVIDQIYLRR